MKKSTLFGIAVLILIVFIGLFYLEIFQIKFPTANVVKQFDEKETELIEPEINLNSKDQEIIYATANDLKIDLFHGRFFGKNSKEYGDFCDDENSWEDLQIKLLLTHTYFGKLRSGAFYPSYVCKVEILQGENIKLYNDNPSTWALIKDEGFGEDGKVAFSQSVHTSHQVHVCCETNDKKGSFCKIAYLEPYCDK